jgi:3-phosphoshikimate 1-carboxyvinyltransferase
VIRLRTAVRPLDAVVDVPGSKSIANRALICAALADGDSVLTNVPDGDDTRSMVDCLAGLGVGVSTERGATVVHGTDGALVARDVTLDAGLAGTTSRFVTAVAALAPGPITVDGAAALRARPMAPLHDALAALGATVTPVEQSGHLPVTVAGPLRAGGDVELPGDVSSQFLTALMLVGPRLADGLRFELTTPLVSRPYVELTAAVMAAFGVHGVEIAERRVVVPPGRYRGTSFAVEPDASSASYPLAMAAVAGGRVEVRGLRASSTQGDARFADLLGRMGCTVIDGASGLGVARDRAVALDGVDVDLAAASDLVPTVTVVAATATSPSTISGVGFIRAKESDRLADLAGELAKAGARVDVQPDGLRIEPVPRLHGAALHTHHDHRLAMAFGVLGSAVGGVEVHDPEVVTKSWPDFWHFRDQLVAP